MTEGSRDSASRHLRRVLGVGFGLAVIIGSTLGIGILRTPGIVAGELQSPSTTLIVWTVGGLYTLVGSICLTELGTMAPQAGGYYVYARRAFGDVVGFAVGWTDWLTYCAVLGYASIGMAEFVGLLSPSLAGAVRWVAIAILIAFVGLQWAGIRVSSRFQEITTALKFLAFFALVVGALALSGRVHSLATTVSLPPVTLSGVIAALQAVIISYGGWQSALYFTEEDRDPSRNLPRAMIGGVAAVIVIYLLINIALLRVLPMSTPAHVNAGGTPTVAMLVTTVVAAALIATGTFRKLVAVASFFLAANYFICCLALVALRRREPDASRAFQAWGYP